MPRIPLSPIGPRRDPRVPNVRQNLRVSPESFGAGEARDLQSTGRGLQNLSGAAADFAVKEQNTINTNNVRNAYNKFRESVYNIRHNDLAPMEGEASGDIVSEAEKQFSAAEEAAASGLTNPVQQEMFKQVAASQRLRGMVWAQGYQTKQVEAYKKSTRLAENGLSEIDYLDVLVSDAPPDVKAEELRVTEDTIIQNTRAEFKNNAEFELHKTARLRSVHVNAVNALKKISPASATVYADIPKVKERLGTAMHAQIKADLEDGVVGERAQQLVSSFPGGLPDVVKSIEESKVSKEVKKAAKELAVSQDAIKERNRRAVVGREVEEINNLDAVGGIRTQGHYAALLDGTSATPSEKRRLYSDRGVVQKAKSDKDLEDRQDARTAAALATMARNPRSAQDMYFPENIYGAKNAKSLNSVKRGGRTEVNSFLKSISSHISSTMRRNKYRDNVIEKVIGEAHLKALSVDVEVLEKEEERSKLLFRISNEAMEGVPLLPEGEDVGFLPYSGERVVTGGRVQQYLDRLGQPATIPTGTPGKVFTITGVLLNDKNEVTGFDTDGGRVNYDFRGYKK